jgi:hypothetical protein
MFESLVNVFMMLLWFGLYGLAIYFLITTVSFMKENNKLNQELLQKMDEFIQLNKKQS